MPGSKMNQVPDATDDQSLSGCGIFGKNRFIAKKSAMKLLDEGEPRLVPRGYKPPTPSGSDVLLITGALTAFPNSFHLESERNDTRNNTIRGDEKTPSITCVVTNPAFF